MQTPSVQADSSEILADHNVTLRSAEVAEKVVLRIRLCRGSERDRIVKWLREAHSD